MMRRRMDRMSSTASGRSAAVQMNGWTAASHSFPSALSPAATRDFSSAWNSHVLAHLR
jgi:hypothetical protein